MSQGPGPPDPVLSALDPADADLLRWCLGEPFLIDDVRRRAVPKLLEQVLRRRRLSLLAHVHLVAAVRDVVARGPLSRLLAVGCGAGVTELFLAATHPEIHFTLADYDPRRLDASRTMAVGLQIDNVDFEVVDLLDDPRGEPYDLVTTVEVLEHIDDDRRVARHLMARSSGHVYTLVPFCSAAEAANERLRERVWAIHEHHRPGYTRESLGALFADAAPVWQQTCYYVTPRGTDDREGEQFASFQEQAGVLMGRAVRDIHDAPADRRSAALGVELLCDVRAASERSTASA